MNNKQSPVVAHLDSLHAVDILQLNHAIHSSLIIREPVPTQYSEVRVEHGLLRLTDAHNFSLCITLEAADPHAAWRLLDLELILPQVCSTVSSLSTL